MTPRDSEEDGPQEDVPDEDEFDEDGPDKDRPDEDLSLGVMVLGHNFSKQRDTMSFEPENDRTSADGTITAAQTMSISHIMNG